VEPDFFRRGGGGTGSLANSGAGPTGFDFDSSHGSGGGGGGGGECCQTVGGGAGGGYGSGGAESDVNNNPTLAGNGARGLIHIHWCAGGTTC
jgi:hypothetical protein